MTRMWPAIVPHRGRLTAHPIALVSVLAMVALVGTARIAAADSTPPRLTDWAIDPIEIDTGTGDVVVTMKYSATDTIRFADVTPPSGVARVNVRVSKPTGGILVGADIIDPPGEPTDRTIPITVKQYSPAGLYRVTVELIDADGNSHDVNFSNNFPPLPTPVLDFFLNAGSVVDNAAPLLQALSFAPTQIDTSAASAVVTLSLRATDALSGIKTIEITVKPDFDPSVKYTISRVFDDDPPQTSVDDTAEIGDQLECNGTECHTVLPRYALPGKYRVTQVKLIDQLGNTRTLSEAQIIAAGITTTFFENTATVWDDTAPQLTSMTALRTFVDVRNGPEAVPLGYSATDDLSGFRSIFVELNGPGSQRLFGVDTANPAATQHSGTIQIALPKGAPAGTYSVVKATLTDQRGNKVDVVPQGVTFQVGSCASDAQCSDGDLCTADSCNPQVGCTHQSPVCAPGDACNEPGVCNPQTGTCDPPVPLPNGSPCDDGLFCNGRDLCFAGACSYHPGDPCALNEECNRTCNEATDSCSTPAGTECSADGNPCTVDSCDGAGTCAHVPGNAGATCRPKAGVCDVAEQCDGVNASCPANQLVAQGQVCRIAANACEVDASCNGSSASCPSNGGPGDEDDDAICDDTDACVNVDDGRNFLVVSPGRVLISKRGAGHRLLLTGSFNLAPTLQFGDVDPQTDGARILLTGQAGTTVSDIVLPAGSYAGRGSRGWEQNGGRTAWTYRDTTGAPIGGIVKMIIRRRSPVAPNQVMVTVNGKNGSYPVTAADLPLQATIVLGDQTASSTGKCGQSLFEARDCSVNGAQTSFRCRM